MGALNIRSEVRSRYKNRIKSNLFFFILLIIIIATTIFLAIEPNIKNWEVTSIPDNKETLEGIDISNHQGSINWKAIDQNSVNFAFIKATEGINFVDKSFNKNWNESQDAGFLVGAYHYFNVDDDGKKQAEHYISVVPKEKHTLPPVIDIEETSEEQAKLIVELRQCAETLEAYYGVKPIFYVNNKTYELYIRDNFEDYLIWYAIYNNPPPIENWTFWQFTDSGSVNGIDGPVDFNNFQGNKEDIMLITN